MNRKEALVDWNTVEEIKDDGGLSLDTAMIPKEDVVGFIDEIEGKVGKALELLNSIKDVSDLGNVEECKDILEELAEDLY